MTTDASFVHLHVHSEYSLLDGAARIEAPKFHPDAPTIFTEAARHGMSAVAVTDHGAMFGALRFFEAGRAAGIKPIIGVEAYVAPGSRFERNPGENEEKYHHLTLLAENETGYRNLLKLVSAAYLEGFYHRPRMDKDLLAEHADGVICLSGCLSSELSTLLLAGQDRRAQEAAGRYRDIFGPDRFFMELQDHGIPDQRRVLPKQIALARSLDIPLVATNDLHYTVRSDAKPHDVLLCIQQQKLQSDPKRLKFDSEEFYLKSAPEMRRVFHEVPEACDNTLRIAERAELDLVYGDRAPADQRFHLPRFETPDRKGLEEYLRELVYVGAPDRYPTLTDDIRRRIDDELDVITQMGFAGYFLIVVGPDQVRARERDPRGTGPWLCGGFRGVVLPADHRPRPAALRPDLRAVPEPRTPFDAGHRHGLRRATTRRGDPLRHRAVRLGSRRADHHVPDDQGEAGHPRRRARAGVPGRRGRPPLQDVPAQRHGSGLPDRGRARRSRRSSARPTRRSPRRRRSSTRRGRSRAFAARTRCTRPAS